MATRPTANTPRFSTSGTNTEPSSGKKAAGWAVNERVPAQWLNWLQWSAGEWVDYFARVLSGEAVTDIAINAANPSASVPVIDVTTTADGAATQFKLLFRFAISTVRHVSTYVGGSGSTRRFMIVSNARWTGTQWAPEDTAAPAIALALRGGSQNDVLELLYHAAGAANWADTAWLIGGFTVLTATSLHVTGPGPAVSAVFEGPVFIDDGLNVAVGIDTAGTLTVGGALTQNGPATFNDQATFNAAHVYLDDDVDIVHTTPQPTRKVQINLLDGIELGGNIGDGYDVINGYLHTTPGIDRFFEYPLTIPREASSWNLEVLWMSADSSHANAFAVFKSYRDLDTAASTPGPVTNMGSRTATVFSTTLAQYASLLSPVTETVEPYNNTYFARITIKGNPAGTNRLYALRLVYTDPGPRNG
jgi:hypothetical protein